MTKLASDRMNTELQSPASAASIKRLPGSSDLLAINNDHSGRFPFPKGKRSPLVAAISRDGGMTWPSRKLIEGDLNGWYCYTAIHFAADLFPAPSPTYPLPGCYGCTTYVLP
jgi:sialidase-1